ncbi:MAG: hypothetical protein GF418_03805 [Chitinivibrionales bacterium]|nr:hypothetical protein [Chitinivibrionales bacterium]MBD3394730.1 hypothetical protein [Chitinivibrionales bacterium]
MSAGRCRHCKEVPVYNENIRCEDGVVCVQLSGTFPREMIQSDKNLFTPLADACAAHDSTKALVDARDLRADLATTGLFQAGSDAAQLMRRGIRIALVARKEMLDPFFKKVSSNRGGDVGVFTDIDEARQWLSRS